jgi:hypothetical protein
MITTETPTIFEKFNAKFLTPEQVADSFVPPDHFGKLCQPCHTVIVGPRGSGKTSLLMMLQTRALRYWIHSLADETRKTVRFIGVFIPTDIVWQMQLNMVGQDYLKNEHKQALVQTAITLHVIRAFVTAIIDEWDPDNTIIKTSPVQKIEFDQEKRLVNLLAECWRISPTPKTLFQLRQKILDRMSDIGYFVANERVGSEEGRTTRMKAQGLIYPGFLDVLRPAIQIVNDEMRKPDLKWALCFDELELAPDDLQVTLIQYLRSTEPTIYFKLSMSPFTKIPIQLKETERKAAEDADYNLIPLWYSEKKDNNRFSTDLARNLLKAKGMAETDPALFFGKPYHAEFSTADAYTPGGYNYNEIAALIKNDVSFCNYIKRHKIDLEHIDKMEEEIRAWFVRKALPSVIHRNYFKKFKNVSEGGTGKIMQLSRSRKSDLLYTGWDAIAAICEGNPRFLNGIIHEIINHTPRDSKIASRNVQWSVVEEARQKFNARINTIRITQSAEDRGVRSLLDLVGSYFEQDLLGSDFKSEPVATFELDEKAYYTYGEAVGFALNAGALVNIPQESTKLLLNDLKGKRFRLCYLLATEHKIPLRIGVSISLHEILKRNPRGEQNLLWNNETK